MPPWAARPGLTVVEHVIDLVLERAVVAHLGHARVGRADGELAAHAVFGVVDPGVFQKRQAAPLDVGAETVQFQHQIVGLFLAGTAVGDAGLRLRGAGIGHEQANADTLALLLGEQAGKVMLGGRGDLDLGHGGTPRASIAGGSGQTL